jgi:diacylglycerol kinase (ATP)
MNRWVRATLNSISGLRFALRNEESFRQEACLLLICLILGFFIAPSAGWYVAMIGSILVILITELLNTAIERLADHVTPEQHPRIGAIKDAGSAAVFCALLLAGLIWLTAFAYWLGIL